MKQKRLTVLILAISSLFSLGAIIGFMKASTVEHLTIENTTEFTATVKRIEIKETGSAEYGIIHTEEYDDKLNVFKINELTNMNDFVDLQTGQMVFFRIENIWLQQLEQADFIHIVSLRTVEKEIISLSDYNEYMHDQYLSIKVICITLGSIFLLVTIYSILMLKNINIFHKLKNNK